MKLTNTDKIGNSKAGPLLAAEFEFDTTIEINDISSIIEMLPKNLNFSLICISGGDSSYDGYNLRFDNFEEALDYINENNMDDATHFIVESMKGLDILGFGFELNTNRMNTSYRKHTDEEVFALIQSIENNIKEKKNNRPMSL